MLPSSLRYAKTPGTGQRSGGTQPAVGLKCELVEASVGRSSSPQCTLPAWCGSLLTVSSIGSASGPGSGGTTPETLTTLT